MKVKRLKELQVNSYVFKVVWDGTESGASFNFGDHEIRIGTKWNTEVEIFAALLHELHEIACIELSVRLHRPDCSSDYIFVYDHRQHDTISCMMAGLLAQFLGDSK